MSIAFLLALIVLLGYGRLKGQTLLSRTNVHLFLLLPLVSVVPAAIFHDQPVPLSLLILRSNFFWLLYFVLHIFNVPAKAVVRLMLFIGCVWIFLTVVQQATYPAYFFYTRSGEGDQEFFRAGVYRFMIDPYQYGLFVLLYGYYKFLSSKKAAYLLLVGFALAGFYYFSTRQIAIGALFCICLTGFLFQGKVRFYSVAACLLLGITVAFFGDQLIGEYVEMTVSQLDDKDDVRLHASRFFLYDYWPHWTTVFTGNGMEHLTSAYGREMSALNEGKGYYRSDVGIIGALNTFGVFYVLNILWLNVKLLLTPLRAADRYLKLFFLFALLLLVISEQYAYPAAIPFFCFLLYLVDKAKAAAKMKLPARRPVSSKETVQHYSL